MKEIISYNIEWEILLSIYKVLGSISTKDFKEKYGLSEQDLANLQTFFDELRMEEEE